MKYMRQITSLTGRTHLLKFIHLYGWAVEVVFVSSREDLVIGRGGNYDRLCNQLGISAVGKQPLQCLIKQGCEGWPSLLYVCEKDSCYHDK